VLAALPETQRGLLQPLLAELDALGIPKEQAFLGDPPLETSDPVRANSRSWLLDLDGDGVTALAAVLRAQPVQLTRTLLAMHAWPWRAQLLQALGDDQGGAEQAVSLPAPSPRLQAAILQSLKGRWQASRAQRSVPPEGAWARFRARVAAKRRGA
jgi:hypothetical protein